MKWATAKTINIVGLQCSYKTLQLTESKIVKCSCEGSLVITQNVRLVT